jgi:hypothetical protein
VFDVDQAAKAQAASLSELLEAVPAFLPEASDLHAHGQESWIRLLFIGGHTAT